MCGTFSSRIVFSHIQFGVLLVLHCWHCYTTSRSCNHYYYYFWCAEVNTAEADYSFSLDVHQVYWRSNTCMQTSQITCNCTCVGNTDGKWCQSLPKLKPSQRRRQLKWNINQSKMSEWMPNSYACPMPHTRWYNANCKHEQFHTLWSYASQADWKWDYLGIVCP